MAGLLSAQPRTVGSPDGAVAVTLTEREGDLFFRATYKARGLVLDSRLGLDGVQAGWKTGKERLRQVRTSWRPVYGDRAVMPERYNELVVQGGPVDVVFRVFDEGIAFQYRIQNGAPAVIPGERTELRFPSGTAAWEEYGTEGEYSLVPVEEIRERCERPLTLQLPSGGYASLLEAGQTGWPRMLLTPGGDGSIHVFREGEILLRPGMQSPWRVLLAGEKPGHLLERSHIVQTLNPPSVLAGAAWIRPGKVLREVTLSTAGGMRAVDFCARNGLQFVEYDAGWYGHEYDEAADATTVSPDPARIRNIPNHGGLDLHAVTAYARQKGIGVILYVNRRALERQMETLFPLYEKWGVAGVKFGFVNVAGQQWAEWLRNAIARAAAHRLMVDVHDSYRPSGLARTYPNLMTQEGVRGNEHMPTARHNATLPFTRALAGAYDYTICWNTTRLKTTRAHQLAQSVIHYSPWQFLFWYDRPEEVKPEPALDFFRELPTVWDETRVLQGAIGESVAIARRKGDRWFLGAITNERARTVALRMDLARTALQGTFYCDGAGPRDVRIEERRVKRGEVLALDLAASGGCAAILRPARKAR